MGLFNSLPKASINFSFDKAYGGFEDKLRHIARRGSLKNLEDNIDDILGVLREYEDSIRHGGLSYGQRERIWQKIRTVSGSEITNDDKKEIKELLQYLGK